MGIIQAKGKRKHTNGQTMSMEKRAVLDQTKGNVVSSYRWDAVS